MEIGNIYHHSIEGVCILSQITEVSYVFLALDIDGKFPAKNEKPRMFFTQKKELPKPKHISLRIRHNAFTFDSIIFYLESACCLWGYSRGDCGDFYRINDENGKELKAHKAVCFQVFEDCGLYKDINSDALEVA